jgi:hypothetical protein
VGRFLPRHDCAGAPCIKESPAWNERLIWRDPGGSLALTRYDFAKSRGIFGRSNSRSAPEATINRFNQNRTSRGQALRRRLRPAGLRRSAGLAAHGERKSSTAAGARERARTGRRTAKSDHGGSVARQWPRKPSAANVAASMRAGPSDKPRGRGGRSEGDRGCSFGQRLPHHRMSSFR